MRNQFTFYKSFLESIEKLPTKKEKFQAYDLICRYALLQDDSLVEVAKPSVCAVFHAIRPSLDTARSKAASVKWRLDNETIAANKSGK